MSFLGRGASERRKTSTYNKASSRREQKKSVRFNDTKEEEDPRRGARSSRHPGTSRRGRSNVDVQDVEYEQEVTTLPDGTKVLQGCINTGGIDQNDVFLICNDCNQRMTCGCHSKRKGSGAKPSKAASSTKEAKSYLNTELDLLDQQFADLHDRLDSINRARSVDHIHTATEEAESIRTYLKIVTRDVEDVIDRTRNASFVAHRERRNATGTVESGDDEKAGLKHVTAATQTNEMASRSVSPEAAFVGTASPPASAGPSKSNISLEKAGEIEAAQAEIAGHQAGVEPPYPFNN
ncbi:uncharacterized protein AB675_11798 [Cyphellophora attinorum]|uniref:Uncharacterized protein n=1 Tax=Cyphellophora attinorum TaxID=1664694 RepID=A0A0N1NZ48_9EURO|nr:uncharacterized protein AB675_11798 [Phialophora attinorum]KPI36796.1 hypothetical protein AB675_11798 [Phialophora attinorum]